MENTSKLLIASLMIAYKKNNNFKTTFQDIDLQQKDTAGNTLLHWAIAHNADIALIQYLIENGIDVNQANDCGATPLHWAVDANNLSIMSLLLDQGAKIDYVDHEGSTPLHWAMNENEDLIITLLIERGADFKKENNHKESLFNWAASLRKEGILKLILDKEKPLKPESTIDKDDKTPLDWLTENDIKRFLKEKLLKSENTIFKLFRHCFFSCLQNANVDDDKDDYSPLKTKSMYGISK